MCHRQAVYCTSDVTLRRGRAAVVGTEEQCVLHILSLCLALRVQHAMRMRRIIICGLSGCTVLSTLSQKGTI